MKKIIFAAMLFFMSTNVATAEWSNVDTGLEITYQVIAAMDWAQTHYIRTHPHVGVKYTTTYNSDGSVTGKAYEISREEANPILGPHPKAASINTYFIVTGITHAAISYGLSKLDTPDWMPITWSQLWQGVSIGVEGGVVIRNFNAGVNLNW